METRPPPSSSAPLGPGPADRHARRRVTAVLRVALKAALGFAAFLVVWQLVVSVFEIPDFLVAPPAMALRALVDNHAELLANLGTTTFAALLGLLLATVSAALVAGLFTAVPATGRALMPFAITLRSIPIVAVAPLIALIVGRGLRTGVACVVVIAFFPLLVNLVSGLRSVPQRVEELMRVHAAGRLWVLRSVRLPYAMPYLFSGLRVAAPLAVLGAMLAEWLTGESGLGVLILTAAGNRDLGLTWSVVIVASTLGVAIFFGCVALERAVFRAMRGEARR